MNFKNIVHGKVGAIAAVALVAGLAGTGASVAAANITSLQVKNGSLQKQDLTKNNFAKFTGTEDVAIGQTPPSTVPAYAGARVIEVAATGQTPLVTIVLDKGTYKLEGSAQFWHIGGPATTNPNLGVVNIPGLQSGYTNSYTAEVPPGGVNPAQVAIAGTVKITANNTPVVIFGSFTGGNVGQAGVSVTATKYEYVKLFKNGQSIA